MTWNDGAAGTREVPDGSSRDEAVSDSAVTLPRPRSHRGAVLPELSRFAMVRPLGEGGGGLIYEVVDRQTGQHLALKTLRELDAAALLQLKEEFHSLQDIDHPNLIHLEELFLESDTWFLTMELVDGVNLLAHVRPGGGPADESRLRPALLQLAGALHAIHDAGKLHLDVKPQNVLVATSGRVVLLDFGLARDIAGRPAFVDPGLVGSVHYMAPEQAAGDALSPAADWYAFGALVYECLVGHPPFTGDTFEVLTRKVEEMPPAPSALGVVASEFEELTMSLLAQDPWSRPSGAEVIERLGNPSLSRLEVPDSGSLNRTGSVFVGRLAELAQLIDLFEGRAQDALTVVVEGESGVGKSALVRQWTSSLPAYVCVLSGRCYERDALPFKAIDGLIDALSGWLAQRASAAEEALLPADAALILRAFPVLRRAGLAPEEEVLGDAQNHRARLFAAVRELFARVAERVSLVAVIDDLQWADADSFALLEELLRPPAAPSMMLVATTRPVDRLPNAAPFGLKGAVRVLTLDRLATNEARELTVGLLGPGKEAIAESIVRESGGHPLFVDELVRHAKQRGGASLRLQLDEAIYERIMGLPVAARELLRVVAVAGNALPVSVAARTSALEPMEFKKHAKTLRVAHLARTGIHRSQTTIETYHDRVRDTVLDRLAVGALGAVHGQLAVAFEQEPQADADALYRHWLGAGNAARAATFALRAADEAATQLAFERAAALYEAALACGEHTAAERRAVLVKLGDTLASAGFGERAAAAFAEAAEGAAPAEALDLRRRVAEEYLTAGNFEEGEKAVAEVIGAIGLRLPASAVWSIVLLLAYRFLLWVRGLRFRERSPSEIAPARLTHYDVLAGVARILSLVDTVRGAYFQARALHLGLRLGEPRRLAQAFAYEGVFRASAGLKHAASAAPALERATQIAERLGDPQALGVVIGAHGLAAFCLGRFREALDYGDRGQVILRGCTGVFFHVRATQLISAWALSWLGHLAELSLRVRRHAREADHRGDLYASAVFRTGHPALAWLRDDDAAEGRALAEDIERRWKQSGYRSQHYQTMVALTQLDLYEGEPQRALARLDREWPRITRSLVLEVEIVRIEALDLRARAHLACAERTAGAERQRHVAAARASYARVARLRTPHGAPLVWLREAATLVLGGDTEGSTEKLRRAAKGFDDASMGLHAAVTRWHLAARQKGGDAVAEQARAEAYFAREGVRQPVRFAAMMAPGFGPCNRR